MDKYLQDLLACCKYPKLEFCWICRERFSDCRGRSDVIRNNHHVIPQCYGGARGPTIALCSHHHDLVHIVANKMIQEKDPRTFLVTLKSEEMRSRVHLLASRIHVAHLAMDNDPNRAKTLELGKWTNSELSKLDELCTAMRKNRNDLIKELIMGAHRNLFRDH